MTGARIRIRLGMEVRKRLDDRLVSDNSPTEKPLLSGSVGVE